MKRTRVGGQLLTALGLTSLVSVGLYLISAYYYGAQPFWFLVWNLVLAWLPLLLAIALIRYLKNQPWVSGSGAALTVLWLAFLPNSFYLISDLVHLGYAPSSQTLYYVIMLFSFSFNGLILGCLSLYLLHIELLKRLRARTAHLYIGLVLLLCSFAVYLGRYLRWSTWDIIFHPIGVVFDVSDRIINPVAYGQTFQVTLLFFVLIVSIYFTLWHIVLAARKLPRA